MRFAKLSHRVNTISRIGKSQFGEIHLEAGDISKPANPEAADASPDEAASDDALASDVGTVADDADPMSLEPLPEDTPETEAAELALDAPEEPSEAVTAEPLAAPEPEEIDPDRPFHILIVGDFSGRSGHPDADLSFKPQLVDRDNFEDIFEEMGVALDLQGIALSFRDLEDFHPDRIYERVPLFGKLDQLSVEPAPPQKTKPAPAGGLLNLIVAEHGEEPAAAVSVDDAGDLAAFIRRVTVGHVTPRQDPALQKRSARRQELASELLRAILHDTRFQSIEAAWRGLFMLIRGLDTDGNVKVFILDITLPELVRDLAAIQETLAATGPWAVIAGNYDFGQSPLDAEVLERIAGMAQKLGAPFVGEARPPKKEVPGAPWRDLRRSPAARWVGLALPRFLLRLPYGKQTSAIESFPFEEMPESDHTAYLWGNPAFFCAYLLGQSFLLHGGNMRRLERRIGNLPMHVYQQDGESVAKPCAEVLMSERDADALMAAGFMPLASMKHQDAAMIVRFQSIASPATALGPFG